MYPVYSPLCDNNPGLYCAYLLTCSNGSSVRGDCTVSGGGNVGEDGNGSDYVVGSIDTYVDLLRSWGGFDKSVLDKIGSVFRIHGGSCGDPVGTGGASKTEFVGVPDSITVGCGSGVVDDSGSADVRTADVPVGPVLNPTDKVGPGRGPHWLRNKVSREKKKASKRLRKIHGEVSWRKGEKDEVARTAFPLVEKEVRTKLQETHARRLIAENEAAALSASRFVSRNDDTEGLVRQMIARMELERKVGKLASSSRIGNWAKTVVGGFASTINSPALSKVPSLESVGLGSSASSDDVVKKQTRLALYAENKRLMEAELESRPYLMPGEVEAAYKALASEFHDVLFTPEQNERRKLADHIEEEYANYGMNSIGAKALVGKLCADISFDGEPVVVE